MRSFVFPQFAKSPILNDGLGLKLPKFDGVVRVNLHRPIPDGFVVKQVRIVLRASGWYAMLSLQADVDIPSIMPGGYPIGIDVGLDSFVATSEGELVVRPRFFVDAQHKTRVFREA